MKRYIFLLGMTGALLAGCAKDEEIGAATDDNQLVPICLEGNIAVAGIDIDASQTRAAVTGNSTVYCHFVEGTGDSVTSLAGCTSKTYTAKTSTAAAALTPTSTSDRKYYNMSNNTKTFVAGVYPDMTITSGLYTSSYGITADVLFAKPVSGSKLSPISEPLVFEHMTSQINLSVAAGDGNDLGTLSSVVISAKGIYQIKLDGTVTTNDKTYTYSNVSGKAIAQETSLGTPVFVAPCNASDVKVTITTSKTTYSNIPVTVEGGKFEKGKSYTLVLRISQYRATIEATITPWKTVEGGNVDIYQ